MNISIPKIVKKIGLKEYAEEFGEVHLEVWVNPPIGLLDKLKTSVNRIGSIEVPKGELSANEKAALEKEIIDIYEEQLGLYSELLSQGSEKTRLSAEELRQMIEETVETDPMFWAWIKEQIVYRINEHRLTSKKG